MLSAIDTQVSYFMNTYPLTAPGQSRQGVTIGLPSDTKDVPSFYIRSLTFNQSRFDPVTSGQMEITYSGFYESDFYSYVKEGDVFRLYEVFGTSILDQSTAAVFTGYIASMRVDYDFTGSESGTRVTIFFYNLLGQWAIQAAVSSFQQQIGQGLTNLNSNQLPLGQVLANLVQGSLFQKLVNQGVLSTNNQSYKGIPLPVSINNDFLNFTSEVWAYIAVNLTKEETLQKILYPYQQIFYQDPSGTIVVDLLKPVKNELQQFQFSYMKPTGKASNFTSGNFTKLGVVHAAAMIPNKVISTLVNMPFVPPSQGIPQNYVATVVNPFSRPQQLQQSGFFEILNVEQDTLSADMITDPTLLAYLTGGIASTGYTLSVLSGKPTIAGTYASRRLAQANIQDTGIFLTQPRQMAGLAGLSPIGTMVNVNIPSFVEAGESAFYCYGTSTSFQDGQGTTFSMELCKPGCLTSFWESAS